jgi:CRP-like cAMP-binding protein
MMPTTAPSAISAVMRNVLMSSNAILSTPEATVEITSLDAQAIEFELAFRVRDFASGSAARNEVYDLIYRHARAAGLALAQPKEAAGVSAGLLKPAAPAAPKATAVRLLDNLPLLASLTEAEKQALAETMTRKAFRKGEVLVEQGAKLTSLMIIRTGVVVVSCHSEEGELELRRLAPGDYFGESGLLAGAGEMGTVRALTFTVVYEVGQAALAKLMQDRPGVGEEISQTLSQRAKTGMSSMADASGVAAATSMSTLVARIRRLYGSRAS